MSARQTLDAPDDNNYHTRSGSLYTTSIPKVSRLFNIFFPSDSIGFRLEPLIAPQMAALPPRVIPSVKRSLLDTVAPESLTGFGLRVGQSVSGLWSSLSSSSLGSFMNRNISSEDLRKLEQSVTEQRAAAQRRGTTEGDRHDTETKVPTARGEQSEQSDTVAAEFRTLYAEFQKHMAALAKKGIPITARQVQRRTEKLRLEEAKVQALNDTGRVDYSIQE